MSIVARFFPNGEFSHGVDTSKQRRDRQRRDTEIKPRLNKERRDAYLQWFLSGGKESSRTRVYACGTEFISASNKRYVLLSSSATSTSLQWEDSTGRKYTSVVLQSIHRIIYEWHLTPLVYQTVESCDKPESRKKLESMTRSMARNIRNAVYLLEQQPGGKDVLSFLTLTLPDLSPDGLSACCQNWDSMVKKFMDWLRITLHRKHIEFQYVYCTEIQSKRLQIRHEYAPHLHIVFRGRDGKKKPWAITPKQARQAWKRCIADVVCEPFRDSALENIQRIRHSAARYLSKYLSKGRCSMPDAPQGASISKLKTQWGGMSRLLSRRIRQFTTRIGGAFEKSELVVGIISNMDKLLESGLVSYYKAGFIAFGIDKTTGLEYGLHVGSGCLRDASYKGGLIPVIEYINRILYNLS